MFFMKKKKEDKPLSKTALKKLIAKKERKATKVFNKFIREAAKLQNPVCPICNVDPVYCCFHIVSAMRRSTRFDERNVIGACTACNNQENYYSDLSRAYYIRTYGVDQYLALVDRSKEDFEFTLEFLDGIITTYQEKLEHLQAS